MEAGSRGAELDLLRTQLTSDQRAVLNAIWEHYRDQNRWMPRQELYERFGDAPLRAAFERLGGPAIREFQGDEEEACRLTFLGVLLTDQGPESEELLVRYLTYVRERVTADPKLEWLGSREVDAALGLSRERSRLLRQLIRLSHWWGGGSGFGNQEWTVGVPVDAEDLPAEPDLHHYVREHVLRHFLPDLSLSAAASRSGPLQPARGDSVRGAFWFVANTALRHQLSVDWHEAQDVCQVRGWKSCVILCGGILEGLLADGLRRAAPPQAAAKGGAPRDRQELAQLIEAATALGFLGEGSLWFPRVLQGFRSLTDPAWQAREKVEVTREDAEAALETVRRCLRQLAALT